MISESRKAYNDRYYAENHDRLLGQKREYRANNKDRVAAIEKAWRKKNPDKVTAWRRAWYDTHPKEREEWTRKYRSKNKKSIAAHIRNYFEQNKDKIYAYHREYYKENIDKMRKATRKSKLKTEYGMSMQEFDAMLESQGGVCAICKCDDWGRTRGRPCIDHDHDTGRVRGILCHKCNVALGLLRNDPAVILAAAAYLGR